MSMITIPHPCQENWDKMQPVNQGRHCSICAKTVVDFTGMTDTEMLYYFQENTQRKICGHFNISQIQQPCIRLPKAILQRRMPHWKRFLTACLLAFSGMLFSCQPIFDTGSRLLGEYQPYQMNPDCNTLTGDSILVGIPRLNDCGRTHAKNKTSIIVTRPTKYMMGKVESVRFTKTLTSKD